jgi:hypothetical protein
VVDFSSLVFGGSVLFGMGVPLVLAVAMPRVISGCFTVASRPAVQWEEDKMLTEMVKLYSHSSTEAFNAWVGWCEMQQLLNPCYRKEAGDETIDYHRQL